MRLTKYYQPHKYKSPFIAQLVKLSILLPRDNAKICIISDMAKKKHLQAGTFNMNFIIINIMLQKNTS